MRYANLNVNDGHISHVFKINIARAISQHELVLPLGFTKPAN